MNATGKLERLVAVFEDRQRAAADLLTHLYEKARKDPHNYALWGDIRHAEGAEQETRKALRTIRECASC